MTIQEVYEKYEHFDALLTGLWIPDTIQAQILHDAWCAIREHVEQAKAALEEGH